MQERMAAGWSSLRQLEDSNIGFLWVFTHSIQWLAERTPSNGRWPIPLAYPHFIGHSFEW